MTKQLEPEPGDMLKNRPLVFEKAEEMAIKYREKRLAEAEGRTVSEVVAEIEQKWQKIWQQMGLDKTPDKPSEHSK